MRRTWLLFSQTVTVALAVLFVVATLKPEWLPQRGATVAGIEAPAFAPAVQVPPPIAPPTLLPGGVGTTSYAAAAKRASPSVVSITASRAPVRSPRTEDPMFRFFFGDRSQQMQQERQVGLGSGVIVSASGYLLTNNHVVKGASHLKVKHKDEYFDATVVQVNEIDDVALLKVSGGPFKPLSLSRKPVASLGEEVFTIGFPNIDVQGLEPKYTDGKISSLAGLTDDPREYQISVPVQPGNSGGPLLNSLT